MTNSITMKKQNLRQLLPAIVAVVFSLVLATLAADDAVTATCQDAGACDDVDTGRYPTWEDAPTSADEFGHDNPEEICRLPIISLRKWEAGKFWCVLGCFGLQCRPHDATSEVDDSHVIVSSLPSRKAIRPAVFSHKRDGRLAGYAQFRQEGVSQALSRSVRCSLKVTKPSIEFRRFDLLSPSSWLPPADIVVGMGSSRELGQTGPDDAGDALRKTTIEDYVLVTSRRLIRNRPPP